MPLIHIEVSVKGGKSVYAVEKVDDISYIARLLNFTGRKPPLYIRLYKTEMGWTSAFEDEKFIIELGRLIEVAGEALVKG